MKPRMMRMARIGLLVFGSALLGATVWQALAQREPQTEYSTLPTRVVPNPDGSVTVRFQAPTGSTNQIFSADAAAESPAMMNWILAGQVVATNAWTDWLDVGDPWRKPPGEVAERYYRVVTLSAPESPNPQTPNPNPPTGLELMAEIGALIGAGNYEGLRALLAASDLSVQELLDLAESQRQQGGCPVMRVFWETVVGPKKKSATEYQLAKAHIRLGECDYAEMNYTAALPHFRACARLVPNTDLGMEAVTAAGLCERGLGRGAAARRYFDQVADWQGPASYRTYALWLKGQSLRQKKKWREAKEAFEQLREMEGGVGTPGTRTWIAEADRKARGGNAHER